MDLQPLFQSGNIWLIAIGIGLTLVLQWAKNKIAPSTPTPTPVPDPNAPAPAKPTFLQALLAFLEQLALSKAKGTIPLPLPPGTPAPTALTSATAVDLDRQAAMHLIGMLGLVSPPPPVT